MKSLCKGLLWMSILIPVFSCSFTEKITSEEYNISEINLKFRDKKFTVLLTTGQQIKAKNLDLYRDSICCRIIGSDSIMTFKFQDVRSITYTDRRLGFLGALIGASAGMLIYGHPLPKQRSQFLGFPDTEYNDAESRKFWIPVMIGAGLGYFASRDAVTNGVEYTNHPDPISEKIIELPLSAVLEEDKKSIKIDYLGRKILLSKSQIKLERKKDSIILKMKAGLYRKTFEK